MTRHYVASYQTALYCTSLHWTAIHYDSFSTYSPPTHSTSNSNHDDNTLTQVRITQGKEPAHFLELFKGKTIVHKGGKASSFKNSEEPDRYEIPLYICLYVCPRIFLSALVFVRASVSVLFYTAPLYYSHCSESRHFFSSSSSHISQLHLTP